MSNYIFVYGTLKHDEVNHDLLGSVKFIGCGLVPGCVLMDLGGVPGMIPSSNAIVIGQGNHYIAAGEVYRIEDEDMPALLTRTDMLEHNGTMYLRVKVNVMVRGHGELECVAYLYMVGLGRDPIFNGWWLPKCKDGGHSSGG